MDVVAGAGVVVVAVVAVVAGIWVVFVADSAMVSFA